MKRRYVWMCAIAIVRACVSSKGEALFSEPVLLGALGGAVIGLAAGIAVERYH